MIETIPSGTILRGKYRIERVLGSGGFGHVYLAIHLPDNQPCAVKEYLVSGPTGQEQLKHEAAVLGQLHHPHLPAFLDAFMEAGRYYIVLNYIEGRDLTDHLRAARQRNEAIPLTIVLRWLLEICDAVMFLHSQRPPLIHRDIKPDNIRITQNISAMLVDLGNAKAAADGARTLFFIRHQGTPGYAPPEQYPGGSGTDTRSDVYALGGTLYFALTAHEPPSVSTRNHSLQQRQPDMPTLQERLAKNPPATPPEPSPEPRQFRLGLGNKTPKALSRHSKHLAQLGQMPPELLDRLNYIIHRAMAMRPQDRYQYVADLANDLKMVLNALPKTLVPSTPVIDPNSTQPDLGGVYDALQATKQQQAAFMPNNSPVVSSQPNKTSTPVVPQPVKSSTPPINPPQQPTAQSQNNASASCQRCGAPLTPNAVFCPHCGTQVKKPPTPPVRPPTSSPQHGQRDIANEQTIIVKMPQENKQPSSPQHPLPPRNLTQSYQQPQSQGATALATVQQPQPVPAMPPATPPVNITQIKPLQTAGGRQTAATSSKKWGLIMVITILILVALAVTLVVVLAQRLKGGAFVPTDSVLALIATMQNYL